MRKLSNYILVLALGAYAGTIASAAPAPDADQPRTMEQVVDHVAKMRMRVRGGTAILNRLQRQVREQLVSRATTGTQTN